MLRNVATPLCSNSLVLPASSTSGTLSFGGFIVFSSFAMCVHYWHTRSTKVPLASICLWQRLQVSAQQHHSTPTASSWRCKKLQQLHLIHSNRMKNRSFAITQCLYIYGQYVIVTNALNNNSYPICKDNSFAESSPVFNLSFHFWYLTSIITHPLLNLNHTWQARKISRSLPWRQAMPEKVKTVHVFVNACGERAAPSRTHSAWSVETASGGALRLRLLGKAALR